jgi:hypothetical protein
LEDIEMKNFIKYLCIITLVVIIGFIFASCDGGGNEDTQPSGGGGNATVATKFRFRNATTDAVIQPQFSMAFSRSVPGPGGVTYQVDDTSFSAYTAFYSTWLGGDTYKVGTGITPTKFIIPVATLSLYGHNNSGETISIDLINSGSGSITNVDFAQGITVNLDNISPGTYTAVQFSFSTDAMKDINDTWHYAKVEFTWPADLKNYYGDSDTNWLTQLSTKVYYFETEIYPVSFSPATYDNANPSSNKVTTDLQLINTGAIEYLTGLDAGAGDTVTVPSIISMFFFGNEYKLYAPNTFDPSQHIPDYHGYGLYASPVLAVPFTTIIIPEEAESATFEIRWDLTGLIQQYKGRKFTNPNFILDTTENDSNDLFVLKNKYWEGLSITATVN